MLAKTAYFRCSPTDMFGDTVAAASAIRGFDHVGVEMTEGGELPRHYLLNQKPKG